MASKIVINAAEARAITAVNGLTADQIKIIVSFERAGAALSIFGVVSIFVAFTISKRVRTVPSTFIVFASFANLGASIACLIGYNGIEAGADSALCEAQAFMLELFMQSDPWWSFAMAVNVYMVFFFSANPKSFLDYWWAYFIMCYGVPFIPALWLLLVRGDSKGSVYGNATMWCWIDNDWSALRIYTYYLPIWVCIFLSTCVYIAVGYYVFRQRNQLRNLSLSNPARDPPTQRDSAEKKLFSNAAGMGSIAAEVTQVTTVHQTNRTSSNGTTQKPSSAIVNWFDGPVEDQQCPSHEAEQPASSSTCQTVTLITADPVSKESWYGRLHNAYRHWCNKFNNMDPVKLAYLRTSFVFAISVLVTWTPSSINRVHDVVLNQEASFGLNLASSIVLPLQGVWNAAIFFSTSISALREEIKFVVDRLRGLPRGHQTASEVRCERERAMELDQRIARHGRTNTDGEVIGSTMRVMRDGSLGSL